MKEGDVDKIKHADEGWTPPTTHAEVWKRFSARHGDNEYTRAIHRKWIGIAHDAGLTRP